MPAPADGPEAAFALKLLFDANLSPKLVARLAELFPGSAHVFNTGFASRTADVAIWEYARTNVFVIVTADSDFLDLAKQRGRFKPGSSSLISAAKEPAAKSDRRRY